MAYDGSDRRSAQILHILLYQGPERGYLPKLEKPMFIINTPANEEASRRALEADGLMLWFVLRILYWGGFLGSRYELEDWV